MTTSLLPGVTRPTRCLSTTISSVRGSSPVGMSSGRSCGRERTAGRGREGETGKKCVRNHAGLAQHCNAAHQLLRDRHRQRLATSWQLCRRPQAGRKESSLSQASATAAHTYPARLPGPRLPARIRACQRTCSLRVCWSTYLLRSPSTTQLLRGQAWLVTGSTVSHLRGSIAPPSPGLQATT